MFIALNYSKQFILRHYLFRQKTIPYSGNSRGMGIPVITLIGGHLSNLKAVFCRHQTIILLLYLFHLLQ